MVVGWRGREGPAGGDVGDEKDQRSTVMPTKAPSIPIFYWNAQSRPVAGWTLFLLLFNAAIYAGRNTSFFYNIITDRSLKTQSIKLFLKQVVRSLAVINSLP